MVWAGNDCSQRAISVDDGNHRTHLTSLVPSQLREMYRRVYVWSSECSMEMLEKEVSMQDAVTMEHHQDDAERGSEVKEESSCCDGGHESNVLNVVFWMLRVFGIVYHRDLDHRRHPSARSILEQVQDNTDNLIHIALEISTCWISLSLYTSDLKIPPITHFTALCIHNLPNCTYTHILAMLKATFWSVTHSAKA